MFREKSVLSRATLNERIVARGQRNMWYVYILKCRDGSYYTGISTDIERRLKRHNDGKGAKYTKVRRPVTLVYVEEYISRYDAENREVEIKSYSVKNKERLIKYGNNCEFPSGQKG